MYSSCRGAELGGAKSTTACIMSLRIAGKNNVELAVSTQTSYQATKFNSLSNLPALRYVDWLKIW